MLPEHDGLDIALRRENIGVRDEVSEIGVVLLSDRRLQRGRLSRDLHDFLDLVLAHVEMLRQLLYGGLVAELQRELPLHL